MTTIRWNTRAGAIRIMAAAALAAAWLPLRPGAAEAAQASNPKCADLGYALELKVDPPVAGTYTSADGALTVTVTFTGWTGGDPKVMDWTSDAGVDAVLLKAGRAGNGLYEYDPEAVSGTGLTTPGTGNGISHISFCYDIDATGDPSGDSDSTSTPTSTDEPTETSTPTPTDEPTETSTPTPTDEPTQTSTPTPTDEPTQTSTPTPTDEPTETSTPTPEGGLDPEGSTSPTPEPEIDEPVSQKPKENGSEDDDDGSDEVRVRVPAGNFPQGGGSSTGIVPQPAPLPNEDTSIVLAGIAPPASIRPQPAMLPNAGGNDATARAGWPLAALAMVLALAGLVSAGQGMRRAR